MNNDHLSIDLVLEEIESKINKISSFKSDLYKVYDYGQFEHFRQSINKFLFELDNKLVFILNSFKEIQLKNRSLYDHYAQNQNDFEELSKRYKFILKENKLLNSHLNDANQKINYYSSTIQNQDHYINELIDKIKGKEMSYFGCQLTRRTVPNIIDDNIGKDNGYYNSKNLHFNYGDEITAINNEVNKEQNYKLEDINISKQNDLKDNKIINKQKDNKNSNDIKMEDINILFTKRPIEPVGPIAKAKIEKNESLLKEKDKEINNVLSQKEKEREINNLLNQKEKRDIFKENEIINKKKGKINRIEDILLSLKDKNIANGLQIKFGKDFPDNILKPEVTDEEILQVEKEIENIKQGIIQAKEEEKKELIELKDLITNSEKLEVVNKKEDYEETENFDEKGSQSSLNKNNLLKKSKNKKNEINLVDYNIKSSSLKNYFLMNLKRDSMIKSMGKK